MQRHSPRRQRQPECLRMPHSTNLTFVLVELHGLKWFNFSMRPLSLGDGCRRDRVNRRVVERHMAASGVTAIDPEVRPGPVGFQSYSCRTPSAPLTSLIVGQRRPHHPARVAGLRVKSTPLTTMPQHQADGGRDEARIDAVRCPESAAHPGGAAQQTSTTAATPVVAVQAGKKSKVAQPPVQRFWYGWKM
jgi:hypothetical protein